jgi:hypothetical protein
VSWLVVTQHSTGKHHRGNTALSCNSPLPMENGEVSRVDMSGAGLHSKARIDMTVNSRSLEFLPTSVTNDPSGLSLPEASL